MASNKNQRHPVAIKQNAHGNPNYHQGDNLLKMALRGSATAQSNQPRAFYLPLSQNYSLHASPNREAVQSLPNYVGTYPSGQGMWYPPQHIPQHNNSSPQLSNIYAPLHSSFPAFPASISMPQQQMSGSGRATIPSNTAPLTPSPSTPSPTHTFPSSFVFMPVSSPSPQVQDMSQPNLYANSPSDNPRPRKKLRGASTTGSRTSRNTTNTPTTSHSPFLPSSPIVLGWTPPLVPGSPSMSSLLPSSQRISPSPSVVSPTQQGSSSHLSSSPQIRSATPSLTHTKSKMTRYSSSTSSHSPRSSSSLAYTPSPYTPASQSSSSNGSLRESSSPTQIHRDASTTSSLSYPAVPLTLPAANPTALGLPQQQPYEYDVPKVAGKKRKRKRDAEDIDNKLKRSSTFSFSVPTLDDGSSTSPIVIRSRSNSPVLIIPTAAVPTPTSHASHAPPTPLELAAILESQCLPPHLLHIPIPQNPYPAPKPTPPPTVASLIELANNLHAQKALATQQLQRDRRTLEALEAREQARERVQKMGFEYRYLVSEDLGRFVNPNERYPCDE